MAWWHKYAVEANEYLPPWVYILAFILYVVIFIGALVFISIIRARVRKNKMKHITINAIYGIYVASAFFALNGMIIRLSLYLSNGELALLYLSRPFLYPIGFIIVFWAYYVLAKNTINLRQRIQRWMKIFVYIEIGLAVFGDVFVFMFHFYDMGLSIYNQTLLVGSFTLAGVITVLFSSFLLYMESRRNANEMSRLRLKMMALGTVTIPLDLAGLMTAYILKLGESPFLAVWHQILVPILSFLFNLILMVSFYYSLFPPMWLQRKAGLLPPSFVELMQKSKARSE